MARFDIAQHQDHARQDARYHAAADQHEATAADHRQLAEKAHKNAQVFARRGTAADAAKANKLSMEGMSLHAIAASHEDLATTNRNITRQHEAKAADMRDDGSSGRPMGSTGQAGVSDMAKRRANLSWIARITKNY
jgi:hypothetical protein